MRNNFWKGQKEVLILNILDLQTTFKLLYTKKESLFAQSMEHTVDTLTLIKSDIGMVVFSKLSK